MNPANRNLLVRVASVAVLLPVVVTLLYYGGAFSGALFAVAAAVCAGEYYRIALGEIGLGGAGGLSIAFALPLLPVFAPASPWGLAFAALTLLWAWSFLSQLFAAPISEAPGRTAHLLTGALYPAIGLTALSALRMMPGGLGWVFVALMITWANDTLAYFAGRAFGRRKLFPAVSPNKTWEGFFGGLLGSVGGLFALRAIAMPALSPVDCVLLGLGGGVLGPLGDLCESLFKRAHGVKDSGRIIPGHGGLLDRIDALLFVAPAVLGYARWVLGR